MRTTWYVYSVHAHMLKCHKRVSEDQDITVDDRPSIDTEQQYESAHDDDDNDDATPNNDKDFFGFHGQMSTQKRKNLSAHVQSKRKKC